MIKGLITAIRTLTILPIPGKDAEDMAQSLPWFPIVGLLLGGIVYGLVNAVGLISGSHWPEGAAALAVGAGALLTRGLHLDGLADWADGFGGRGDRKRSLAIMKDPHTGSFGVAAIVVLILVKWVSFARITELGIAETLIAAYVVSRTMMVELAVSQPYARAEGGTAESFVKNGRLHHRIIAHMLSLSILIVACGPVAGLVCHASAWIIATMFGMWSKKRLGGVTGDVLGAGCEIMETAVAVVFALIGTQFLLL